MPELSKYLKRVKQYGTDLVLETAATDPDISDKDYDRLFKAVDERVRSDRHRPKGISPIHKLRAREAAAEELAP